MTNTTSNTIGFLHRLELLIPQWFWKGVYPWIIPILIFCEIFSGAPSLWRAIVAENLEGMPIETHVFNIVIGLIMIPYGIDKKDRDMVALGFLMLIMYSITIVIALLRGGVFLWQ